MNLRADTSFLRDRHLPLKIWRGSKPHPDGKGAELKRRKYGAKEYLSEFSLAEYDFDARRLITSTGTFSQPDPLAGALTHPETGKPLGIPYLASFSPYSYCAGDPINFTDPTGKLVIFVNGYIGFGVPGGGKIYWTNQDPSFVKFTLNHSNEIF